MNPPHHTAPADVAALRSMLTAAPAAEAVPRGLAVAPRIAVAEPSAG